MSFGAAKKNFWRSLRINSLRQEVKKADADLRVVLGAGGTVLQGWIHTDIDTLDITSQADWQRYFIENSISALLAEHVWEHLTSEQAALAVQNCFIYLRPGGYLRLAVPDGFNPDAAYIEYVKVGGLGVGADDHEILYNYVSVSKVLSSAGFQVKLLEYFDEQGKFHTNEWDATTGKIERSQRFDPRNAGGQLKYTSLIVDAIK